jgi:predicted enzyme related to lactoylglutathione lyase
VPGNNLVAYWGVANADESYLRLLRLGATVPTAVQDVGGGIRVATVADPFGNIFGIIENPGFALEP